MTSRNRPHCHLTGGVNLSFHLKPHNDQFFIYFEQLADAAVQASNILKEHLEHPWIASQKLALINSVEERGDRIVSELVSQIKSTFLTPIDSEDMLMLAAELNSIIGYIQGVLEKIIMYKKEGPRDIYMLKMTVVVAEASEEIKSAAAKLSENGITHNGLIQVGEKMRLLKQEGGYLSRTGIALLFVSNKKAADIIKWKEIYRQLKTTLDCFEKVGNILKGIAVKYV